MLLNEYVEQRCKESPEKESQLRAFQKHWEESSEKFSWYPAGHDVNYQAWRDQEKAFGTVSIHTPTSEASPASKVPKSSHNSELEALIARHLATGKKEALLRVLVEAEKIRPIGRPHYWWGADVVRAFVAATFRKEKL